MNDILKTFEAKSLSISSITTTSFILNIILIFVLTYLLGIIYRKYGNSISNRSSLASSFPLLGLSTMVVITVVKSSLSLSLGLVGALSIVRFRTPIKEPEELIYLFICIATGLAIGADQLMVAIFTLLGTYLFNFLMKKSRLQKSQKSGGFTVFINADLQVNNDDIIKIFKKYCNFVGLKRFTRNDDDEKILNLQVVLTKIEDLQKITTELNNLSESIKLDMFDSGPISVS